MKRVAQFYKVSEERFCRDWEDVGLGSIKDWASAYVGIVLPRRATAGSAGYDFYSPVGFELRTSEMINIPTGIRCRMDEGYMLGIYPRSGLGFKYRLQLNNTVGIIDSDYYHSSNEGHIFIKLTNDSKDGRTVAIGEGMAFAQGIFLEYGITVDDVADKERDGGFGSTT